MQNTIIHESRLIQLFVPRSRISQKMQSRACTWKVFKIGNSRTTNKWNLKSRFMEKQIAPIKLHVKSIGYPDNKWIQIDTR